MHLNKFFAGTLSREKSRREFSILIDSSTEDNALFNDFYSGWQKDIKARQLQQEYLEEN
jgi:hypothetical protein